MTKRNFFRLIIKLFGLYSLFFISLYSTPSIYAQTSDDLWTKTMVSEKSTLKKIVEVNMPSKFVVYDLNLELLKSKLNTSLKHSSKKGRSGTMVTFPNELGQLQKYEVFEASIMSEGLQSKFPGIKSYIGNGVDNPASVVRFSITSVGLNAMILKSTGDSIYINPYIVGNEYYKVYSTDKLPISEPYECQTEELSRVAKTSIPALGKKSVMVNDGKLRKFRLAIAVTGEYSQYHLTRLGISSSTTDEEKKEVVLSVIISTMTNVISIFERDLGITMNLVANNSEIIFLDPNTDNLTNNSYNIFNEAQEVITNIIGFENYDIGHTFSSGIDGGIATFPSACNSQSKATAASGSGTPIGYNFENLIKHEMGHQLGANHTFNGVTELGDINPSDTRVEPGSGSTIMSYPGTCVDNVQLERDNYFHFVSIREIRNEITTSYSECATIETIGNNPPEIQEIPNYVVPVSTPFAISVNATDSNNNQLTYTVEQLDNELAVAPPVSTATEGPLFRSIPPNLSSIRYFPDQKTVIDGKLGNTWEVLPSISRTIKLGVLVRDNNTAGGQTVSEETTLTFDGKSGPFKVTTQNESTLWFTKTTETIRWNVAETNLSVVNCTNVNILLSTDGGYTFPIVLAENTLNDGVQEIEVPDITTATARIKVESVGNIFYSININDIAIKQVEHNDYDDDGIKNEIDLCPYTPIGEIVDANGCSDSQLDDDNDGIVNSEDNCIDIANPDQADIDNDGIGDACDEDIDGDAILNVNDNCLEVANTDQSDIDNDGIGDVCDEDSDGDGVHNSIDNCWESPLGETVGVHGCTEEELVFPDELWGMANYGGLGFGVMFAYNYSTDTKTAIHDFYAIEDGRFPSGSLIQAANGNLYGMTRSGGVRHLGALFEYNIARKKLTKKVDFDGKLNGQWPEGDLIQASNDKLYGMATEGGEYNKGVLFEYDIVNDTYTKKVDFDGVNTGSYPHGSLLQASNGKLYGTTVDDGAYNKGVLFEYDVATDTFNKILDFDGTTTGSHCFGSLIQAANGKIYGMTRYGGTFDRGVIFEFDMLLYTLTIKFNFDDSSSGGAPVGSLVEYSNNKFYGMTQEGGSNGFGTLFEYDLNIGIFTKKIDFDGGNLGSNPHGSLLKASNGFLYGMTSMGGFNEFGVLFGYNPETDIFQKKFDFYDSGVGYFPNSTTLIEISMDLDNDGVLNMLDQCSNTPAGEVVNASGCSESQIDDDGDGVMNDTDLCPETPTGEIVDANGCSDSQLDDDNDGVMNDTDQCPETPTGEIIDVNGCSVSQLDDDNDGVMNDVDTCSDTPIGTNVDDIGCPVFTLPSENFTIETTSETCPSKNNGQIFINATETYDYVATVNDSTHNFTNNSLAISDLQPGIYNVCITVTGETFEQCFTITIKPGASISGKTSVTSKKANIEINKGTAPYTVFVNGKNVLQTMMSSFDIDVIHGDLVEVKTDVHCEGVFSQVVNLLDEIMAYPNPTTGIFELALPISLEEINIELFTINSQLISADTYSVVNGKVKLSLLSQPEGIYIVKIYLDTTVNLTVIKK